MTNKLKIEAYNKLIMLKKPLNLVIDFVIIQDEKLNNLYKRKTSEFETHSRQSSYLYNNKALRQNVISTFVENRLILLKNECSFGNFRNDFTLNIITSNLTSPFSF